MAHAFSVFVNIGGKVSPSLGASVSQAKAQVNSLAASMTKIGASISAPFIAVNKHIDAVSKRMEKATQKGRDMSLAVTMPAAMAARSGWGVVYGFEKELNKIQAYGELSDAERQRIEDNAREMARLGLAGAKSAVELQRRYVQAGRSVDQAIGMARPTLNFSLFGDVDPAKAADVVTTIAASYQKPMETLEQAAQVATRIGDVLAKGANISRADVSDFAEGFKYVAPLAYKAGMSVEQVAAAIATMNQNGLKGNEAGVALRSMLIRMVKPTAGARAAIEGMGLSFEQFVGKWEKFDGNALSGVLALNGINVKKPLMDSVTNAVKDMDPQTQAKEIREKVTAMLVDGMDLSPRDGKVAAKTISGFLGNMAEEVDADALIRALEDKNVSLGEIANLFDVRQGARLSTLFNGDLYQRMLGRINEKETDGASARGAATMLKGLVGASLRLQGAWDNLWISIARSGVLDAVTDILERMSKFLDDIGKSSPGALKFGVGLIAAAAAAGPLLFILGALGRVGLLAMKGLNAGLALLLAPIGLLARGIVGIGATLALGVGRLSAMVIGLRMLTALGAGATLAALGGSLLALGRTLISVAIVGPLRAIGAAMWFIVANPVGVIIAGLVAALAALGVWVYNNWSGIKEFFAGFGEGFMKGLGPAGGAIKSMADGLGSVVNWLGQLLGPLDESGTKWRSWGETMGGVVASGVRLVIDGISKLIGFLSTVVEKAGQVGSAIKGMFSSGSASGGSKAPFVGNSIAGARALGGPVSFGKPYLVGERGPELFVPGASGRIETNDTLRRLTADGASVVAGSSSNTTTRGPVSFNPVFNISGGDPREVAGQVRSEMQRFLAELESEQRGYLSD